MFWALRQAVNSTLMYMRSACGPYIFSSRALAVGTGMSFTLREYKVSYLLNTKYLLFRREHRITEKLKRKNRFFVS